MRQLKINIAILIFTSSFWTIPQVSTSQNLDSLWAVWIDENQADSARLKAIDKYINPMFFTNIWEWDSVLYLSAQMLELANSSNNLKYQVHSLFFLSSAQALSDDHLAAKTYAEEGLKLAIKFGDNLKIAQISYTLGRIHYLTYNYPQSLEYFNKSSKYWEVVGDTLWLGLSINFKGLIYKAQGEYSRALFYYNKTLENYRNNGNQWGINIAKGNIALIHAEQGNFLDALTILKENQRYYEEMGDSAPFTIAENLKDIGRIYSKQGNYTMAMTYYYNALKRMRKLKLVHQIAETLLFIGIDKTRQGKYIEAMESFEESLLVYREISMLGGIAKCYDKFGFLYYTLENYPKSLDYYYQSLAIFQEIEFKKEIADSYGHIGQVISKQLKYDTALEYYQKSLNINEEIGRRNAMSDNYRDFGASYKEQGKYLSAFESFEKSRLIREEIGDRRGMAEVYIDLGDLNIVQNKIREGLYWCQKGYDLAVEIGVLKLEQEAAYCLYKAHKALGNGDQALDFHEKHLALQDSLKTDEASRQLQQMEFNRQRMADSLAMVEEQLKTELAHQETLSSEKNTRNTMAIAGFAILLVAAGLFGRMRFVRKTNKKLEEKNKVIAKEKERAEESERAKEQFFDNVSHEFRTPLTLILGPLEEALGTTTDENIKPRLQTMQRNALRLHEMINELLNLSKLEFGKIKLQAKEENIVKLTEDYLQSFESLADQKRINLEFKSSAKSYKAWVDAEQFRKILANLLSNAFKFTEPGGSVKVKVFSRQLAVNSKPTDDWRLETEDLKGDGGIQGGGVQIKISDTGIGIPADKLPHIFDRFFQVGESSQAHLAGTGIGLALTKELVGLHHGTISVESEKGKGTSFSVFLPFGSDHLSREEIRTEEVHEIEDTKPVWAVEKEISGHVIEEEVKKKNELPILLIAEDNKDMRSYIKSHLDKDYTIIEASDGEEGLQKTIEQVPDLIISDVMMPKLDGYQMTDMIKADPRTSHIPVLILTARSSVESRIEGLETGADAYLIKPFNARELKVRIKKLIEQRQKLREHFSKTLESLDEYLVQDPKLTSMDQQFVQNAQDVVNKNLSDSDFDAKTFASGMALSRVQLHRKIKALTDKTTTEFVRTIRLNRAAILLKNHTGNVSDIAFEVGFSSLSYFTKVFKEQFGKTPSEFAEPG